MNAPIRSEVLASLACPQCASATIESKNGKLACSQCGYVFQTRDGKLLLTSVPSGMKAAPKLVRGRDEGSEWRKANWRFLESVVARLPQNAIILDFGAGHGDFSEILAQRTSIALDIFPYEEVDVICDLQQIEPFKKQYFDAIVLMNVLEHTSRPQELLNTLTTLLKPAGRLILTVPFLLKLHQLPYDFTRFTHIQLREMGLLAGLELVEMEGYYDPFALYTEGQNNLRSYVLQEKGYLARKIARLISLGIDGLLGMMKPLIGAGFVGDPAKQKSPYPIGYQLVFKPGKGKRQ